MHTAMDTEVIRILHVDDSETDLELIKFQLTRHDKNLEIECAESVEEALHKLESQQFDCILSDFQMPGSDGLDLLKAVRNTGISTPFIFLTGQGNEEIASEALRAGADDYYTKDAGFAHYHRLLNSIRRVVEAHNRRANERLAENALEESEKKYRHLIDRANDLIFIIQDNKLVFSNPKITEMLGYTVAEVLNTPATNYVHPDAKELVLEIYNKRIAGEEAPHIYEAAMQHKDGSKIDVEINAGLIEFKGKLSDFVIMRDITERKKAEAALRESEERLSLALLATNDGLWDWDLVTNETYFSPRWYTMLGYEPDEFPHRYDSFAKLIHPDDRDQAESFIKAAIDAKEGYEAELRMKSKSGEWVWILTRGKVVERDENEHPTRLIGTHTNITERKRTEERLALALLATNDGLWDWNFKTGTAYFSPRYYAMIGYEPDDFPPSYDSWRNLVHPDDLEETEKAINNTIEAAEGGFEIEYRFRAKSGEWRWILGRGKVVERDENGKPQRIIGTHVDVTIRKEAESKLAESEERHKAIIGASIDGISIADVETLQISYTNERFGRMLGYADDELIGMPVFDLIPKEDIQKAQALFKDTLDGRISLVEKIPFLRKDGSTLFVDIAVNTAEIGGQPYIVGFFRDITEQMASEVKIRNLENERTVILNSMVEHVVLHDLDMRVVWANKAACEAVDAELEDIVGRHCFDVWRKLNIPCDNCPIRTTLETGKDFTAELRSSDGSIWQVQSNPVIDENGAVIGVVETSLDITERRRAEDELKKSKEQLERHTFELEAVNKELEAFSYSVSHDLRAPLRHIDGFTSLLLEDYADKLDDNGRDFLNRTKSSTAYMTNLIDGMLKLSRLSRTELKRENLDLSSIAASIADKLGTTEPGRDVTFEIADDVSCTGDVHLIHSVLENLLGNAFKFTAKKKKAKIEFGATTQDSRTIYFIRDNGAGFDPGKINKLFIPFSRLHTDAEFEGTGIGLATVRRVILRHGGRVWAESEIGKGTTFYFTLP